MTAEAALDHVISRILEDEGGVKDVGDGKGITRFGQTPGWLEDLGLVPPANAADAAANYQAWMVRTRLAELCARDVSVGYLVTDFAVNSGLKVAVNALQQAMGVKADGVLGPITLGALTQANAAAVARRVLATQLELTGDLLSSTKVDRRKWARGWLRRHARKVLRLP